MPSFPSSHVSLVTGASTGIGAATALDLARNGSSVAIHYHSSGTAASEVAESIRREGGVAWVFRADLARADEARRLTAEVLATCGRVDVLVNNAGSMLGRRPFLEVDDDFWQQTVDLNFSSVFWMTKALLPHMLERGDGVIINVSSIAARNGGGPGGAHYAAAKAGVTCLTKGLAKEFAAKGIRVNAVHPGVIDTPFHARFSTPERLKAFTAAIPQGRLGRAEDVAGVITFLASSAAVYLQGEAVEINGGMLMD